MQAAQVKAYKSGTVLYMAMEPVLTGELVVLTGEFIALTSNLQNAYVFTVMLLTIIRICD